MVKRIFALELVKRIFAQKQIGEEDICPETDIKKQVITKKLIAIHL